MQSNVFVRGVLEFVEELVGLAVEAARKLMAIEGKLEHLHMRQVSPDLSKIVATLIFAIGCTRHPPLRADFRTRVARLGFRGCWEPARQGP